MTRSSQSYPHPRDDHVSHHAHHLLNIAQTVGQSCRIDPQAIRDGAAGVDTGHSRRPTDRRSGLVKKGWRSTNDTMLVLDSDMAPWSLTCLCWADRVIQAGRDDKPRNPKWTKTVALRCDLHVKGSRYGGRGGDKSTDGGARGDLQQREDGCFLSVSVVSGCVGGCALNSDWTVDGPPTIPTHLERSASGRDAHVPASAPRLQRGEVPRLAPATVHTGPSGPQITHAPPPPENTTSSSATSATLATRPPHVVLGT